MPKKEFRFTTIFFIFFPFTFFSLLTQLSFAQIDTGYRMRDTIMQIKRLEVKQWKNENTNNQSITPILSKKTTLSIDTLKQKMQKRLLTKELSRVIFVSRTSTNTVDTLLIKFQNNYFLFQGKTIKSIRIYKNNIFGKIINDTIVLAPNWLAKSSNKMHLQTRDKVLYNNLLFKVGDRVDSKTLAENERLLRDLPYIHEAKIIVNQNEIESDAVDILVVTQDIWSLGFDGGLSSIDRFDVNLYNANFLGMGHRLDNKILMKTQAEPYYGYSGRYRIQNTGVAFISAELNYRKTIDDEMERVRLARPYLPSKFRYEGAVDIRKVSQTAEIKVSSNSYEIFRVNYNMQDHWLGRTFNLQSDIDNLLYINSLLISTRIINKQFKNRPQVTDSTNELYYNGLLVLAGISYTKHQFLNGRYIFGYGRTEDVPYGHFAEFVTGWQSNEYVNRAYFGLRLLKGWYSGKGSSFYSNFNIGGFVRKKRFEQVTIDLKSGYFGKLYKWNRSFFRMYCKMQYTVGIHKMVGDTITIAQNKGIRGLYNDQMYGTRRLTMSCEPVLYSHWLPANFRLACFAFADVGFIGRRKIVIRNTLYTGIGIGFRFKNEELVFPSVELRFAFYPNLPINTKSTSWYLGEEFSKRPYDYNMRYPELINFE